MFRYYWTVCIELYQTDFDSKDFYIITLIDVYSRFVRCYAVETIPSRNIIDSLTTWIKNYGTTKFFFTDNGKQYTSGTIQTFYKKNQIKHILAPRYSPQSNGLSETINRPIKNILRIYKSHDIGYIISRIENFFNYSTHTRIGLSPYEIIYKHSPFDIFRKEEVCYSK